MDSLPWLITQLWYNPGDVIMVTLVILLVFPPTRTTTLRVLLFPVRFYWGTLVPGVLKGIFRTVFGPLAKRIRRSRLTGGFSAEAFVIDGDTIAVGEARVRLFGIDAPELAQLGGAEARDHLRSLIGEEQVEIHPVEIDRYGRTVARVFRNGQDLGEAMVRDGYAVVPRGYSRGYLRFEKTARRTRAGLWGSHGGIADPASFRRVAG